METRAVLYARYSTDHQSPSSIEDQHRQSRERAAREGWTVVGEYGDVATSGSKWLIDRVAGRELAAAIAAKRFDVLVIEGLDRLSRDQLDQESWVRRIEYAKIRIVGISDGYDSCQSARKITRNVRGLINEIFIDDLRWKTHRGQTGKVLGGYVAGGKSYGYNLVRHGDARQPMGSTYAINLVEAGHVRFIFERFADGESCRRIAHALNGQMVPSPRRSSWSVSAIYGSPRKGSGILNNLLYVGRYIWNRSQWTQDPATNKRKRVDRPPSEWHEYPVPELRIVPQETWDRVRTRMDHGRDADGVKPARRPASALFSGIIRCPECSGPLSVVDASHYGCGRAKDRGPTVCTGFRIRRRTVDERLSDVIRTELLSAEAAQQFSRMFEEELTAIKQADVSTSLQTDTARAQLKGEIDRLVGAIGATGHSAALLERLRCAECELTALKPSPTIPTESRHHPPTNAIRLFAEKLHRLDQDLARDAHAARNLIAELVGQITIELRGDEVWARLATERLVHLATGQSPDNVVAGTGFEPVTFGL